MNNISVLISAYNKHDVTTVHVREIMNSTFIPDEIIVVNDCSPDYLDDLMQWYIKQDSRIKYHLFETNRGVCEARNFGNQMAEADLLFVSDQDDLSLPNRVKDSVDFMETHPEVDCLTSWYLECDVDGNPVKEFHPEDMTREIFERGGFVWFHSSACYRKKDILALPYREDKGATDDWVFLDSWTKAGKKFHTLPKVLGLCRRLPGGQMNIRREVQGLAPSYIL